MRDVLMYYCGGNRHSVIELLVSLYSLLESNPKRTFQIGVALDAESRQWIDPAELEALGNLSVQVYDHGGQRYCGPSVHHIVNRWQATKLFGFDRLLILDTDTIVNHPLDSLFDDFPDDPEFFVTFAGLAHQDRKWEKHRKFYDAVCSEYDRQPLYCSLSLHGFRQGWPYLAELVSTLIAMDGVQGNRRGNRALLIDEFAMSLVLMKHGRKVCFPRRAIARASGDMNLALELLPAVSHFLLGRATSNPVWRRALARLVQIDFQNISRLTQDLDLMAENAITLESQETA